MNISKNNNTTDLKPFFVVGESISTQELKEYMSDVNKIYFKKDPYWFVPVALLKERCWGSIDNKPLKNINQKENDFIKTQYDKDHNRLPITPGNASKKYGGESTIELLNRIEDSLLNMSAFITDDLNTSSPYIPLKHVTDHDLYSSSSKKDFQQIVFTHSEIINAVKYLVYGCKIDENNSLYPFQLKEISKHKVRNKIENLKNRSASESVDSSN